MHKRNPPRSHTEGRRLSSADEFRHKSIEVKAGGRLEPEPDEMDESEAMAEDDERQADDALRTGLEATIQAQEDDIDSTALYSEGEGSDGEEAAKEAAATAAAIAIREQAATTFTRRRRESYTRHTATQGRPSTSGKKTSGTRRSATGRTSKGGDSPGPSCKCRPMHSIGGETRQHQTRTSATTQ
jgi:hypothetical protein